MSLAEFFSYPVVVPKLATRATAWFADHYPAAKTGAFRPALTCSHFSTLKNVVLNSDAISGAIPAALASDLREKRFVSLPLNAAKLYSNPGIVSLKGRSLSPAALAFVAEIQENLPKLTLSAGQSGLRVMPSPPPPFPKLLPARAEGTRRPKAAALR